MSSDSRIILSANDIDLNKHGIIEAHAGTGKTYTIVKMALRMLEQASDVQDKFIHLRDILLVTYTEKAAGELKKRIQEGIVLRIKELGGGVLATHLENCLNNMHEALIGTIHSVCLRLLQTWPFETHIHFNMQIANDAEGIQSLLRESMRTDWQDEATYMPQALRVLERYGISIEAKHINLIQKTALTYINGDDMEIDTSATGGKSLQELTYELENIDAGLKNQKELSRLQSRLIFAFIFSAATALSKRYRAYKLQYGLISYNDMLLFMRDAIDSRYSVMLKTLRQRLRYGIIDEFQDTSPTQWNIFKKIFLNATGATLSSTKMFIVGDPKQSVYSFQNADIQSYITAKNTIVELGGAVYSLVDNYRSLPETIGGYNAILTPQNIPECDDGGDWFLFDDDGDAKFSYRPGSHARPPAREQPQYPQLYKAVQVIAADEENDDADSKRAVAVAARIAIKKLRGTTVSVPKGQTYENITLDYQDFAVIVETHDLAEPFIGEFRKHGIPCVKYKMSGVFKSASARDLRAVLTAICKRHSSQAQAHCVAALLTHFFNKSPETIDLTEDLKYCRNYSCQGDNLCVAHALDHWGKLADMRRYAQLFDNIVERTEIRQKLIRLIDGERKLADLRQVVDYCIEYLYKRNSSLEQLIDHLERLYNSEEQAAQDKNIHTLSSEKSSVAILTMHASKGLEFPVVFIMNRDDIKQLRGADILPWTDDCGKRRFTPCLSFAAKDPDVADMVKQMQSYKQNQKRERRRLLYVALTRPQAMLFVPMREKEKDLSPRLRHLLNTENRFVELFDPKRFVLNNEQEKTVGDSRSEKLSDIPKLSLQTFIGFETSYTQMSKKSDNYNRSESIGGNADSTAIVQLADGYDDMDIADENYIEYTDVETDVPNISNDPLPNGRLSGVALHGALDELLKKDDILAVVNNDVALDKIVAKHLKNGGVFDLPSIKDAPSAVKQAASYIKTALTATYRLACGEAVVIANLHRLDRVSESDFLLSCKPHRIRGFIDLVFRVKNNNHAPHPYRYYIIDWKSDALKNFDGDAIVRYYREKHFQLQAQVYSLAIDKYLRGILGERYDTKENLGGALHIFLRAPMSEHNPIYRAADVQNDEADVSLNL